MRILIILTVVAAVAYLLIRRNRSPEKIAKQIKEALPALRSVQLVIEQHFAEIVGAEKKALNFKINLDPSFRRIWGTVAKVSLVDNPVAQYDATLRVRLYGLLHYMKAYVAASGSTAYVLKEPLLSTKAEISGEVIFELPGIRRPPICSFSGMKHEEGWRAGELLQNAFDGSDFIKKVIDLLCQIYGYERAAILLTDSDEPVKRIVRATLEAKNYRPTGDVASR